MTKQDVLFCFSAESRLKRRKESPDSTCFKAEFLGRQQLRGFDGKLNRNLCDLSLHECNSPLLEISMGSLISPL